MSQSTNAWNEIFKQRGKVFTEPHEDMPGIVQLLKDKGASTILHPRGVARGIWWF